MQKANHTSRIFYILLFSVVLFLIYDSPLMSCFNEIHFSFHHVLKKKKQDFISESIGTSNKMTHFFLAHKLHESNSKTMKNRNLSTFKYTF